MTHAVSEKTCTKCAVTKPLTDFYYSANGKAAKNKIHKSACKECVKASARKWVQDNPEHHARTRYAYELARTYGITIEEYEALISKQGNGCAICGSVETKVHASGTVFRFSVDHCHESGKIRGILCMTCNRGIGLFRDNAQLLRKAADYLEG